LASVFIITVMLCNLSRKRVRHTSDSSVSPSLQSDIENPRHFRQVGRVLSHNVADGTTTIELVRPPHGPYGIYLARDGDDLQNGECCWLFVGSVSSSSSAGAIFHTTATTILQALYNLC